ncbi:choline dehydrogenase [Rhodovarius crocodyli]|uniref:Choline dehydrogenase n=1 Tax=Rhodovarius crocodyli TaxID=1979269 RepID=A0A437MGU4_9PROT|nr:GMC family oxidoreductase N-terminal domain-containing protein [Rhodovarius crocodyli]RVT96863.1 choline dehydrogenase [Rhodovarius crocodyli]
MADTFDYIIIGSGAAGSVLADRLSEDGTASVCVLEAGPKDTNPWIHIPAGFTKTLSNPAVSWQFSTEPTEMTGGRRIPTIQGKVMGGGTSINGMIYNRGQPDDLNGWAQRGNRNWGYADCLPYYKRSEKRVGVSDDTRGKNEGGMPVTDMDWFHPISEAFIEGCLASGLPRTKDYNNGDQYGVGYFQRIIAGNRRRSAARSRLAPAMKRPNTEVRVNARASQLVFEGKRCVGVRYQTQQGADPIEIRANREVILSCGTPNTARLLQVSGIGPAWLLEKLGVAPVHVMPGVGENFRDHYASRFVMRAKPGVITLNELAKGWRLGLELAKWAAGKPSILATAVSHVHLFLKSFEGLDQPDIQGVLTPGSYKPGKTYILDDYPGVSAGTWQHRPESSGYVRARSASVWEDPELQPNYLSVDTDRQVHLAGLKQMRKLLNTPQMSRFLEGEILPGPQVRTDDELLDFARQNGTTTYHLIGSAKMGPATDPMAVVDDNLRIHGLDGIRVVDASIMPTMTSANTMATTLMIAEKASDMIRGKAALAA